MSAFNSHTSSPTRHGSGRHQIKRSISEITSPLKGQRSHQEPRQHDHRHRHLHRKDNLNNDGAPHSALPSFHLRHSLDMPRPDAARPPNHDQSRRPSVSLQRDEDDAPKEETLQKEREKAAFWAEGLQQSLVDLNTFSTATTRRLDETYYAVLEKMSSLQNTVTALKDLAETSRDIYGGFEKDSRGLEHDIVTQLSAVGQFDEQQSTIESLQTRITDGRRNLQSLSQRVDAVRERVEGWERGDKAWQEKTRKRLRLIWIVMVVTTVTVILLFLGVKYTAQGGTLSALDVLDEVAASLRESLNMSEYALPPSVDEDRTDRTLVWRTPVDDGARLRAFDEL